MKLLFNVTREDYSEFARFHFIQNKLKRTIITGLLTVIILQLFMNIEYFDLTGTIISTVAFVLVYAFIVNRSLNKTKNIPDSNGAILGEKEIEFTEDSIIYKTNNSHGTSEWTSIKNLKESSKAFYLYMDTEMAMFVPKRVFKGIDEIEEFKKLVNRKINTA